MSGCALILIVEDDSDIRDSFVEALQLEGHAVIGAADGLDALDRLRKGPCPTLILLDLMMPRMDGIQFRAELSTVPEWAEIPIIVMSADGRVRGKAEAMGATRYLQKPIMLDELYATVSGVLGA
jgi:two-component system response regulator MprA